VFDVVLNGLHLAPVGPAVFRSLASLVIELIQIWILVSIGTALRYVILRLCLLHWPAEKDLGEYVPFISTLPG